MKKWMLFAFALILSCSFLMANAVAFGAPLADPTDSASADATSADTDTPTATPPPVSAFPAPSIIPNYSYPAVDGAVTIPDNNLKTALKAAAGVQPASPIYKSDLAKITGGLDLSNKSISKADGLQYCINITDLNLSGNKLTTLPGTFSGMTNLQNLVINSNKLTAIPDVVFVMTKLTKLSMAGNQIAKLPDKISSLTALTDLSLSGNKLDTVSANISKCTALVNLDLSGSSFKLKQIPKEICLLPNLVTLNLSGNTLSALPDEIRTMPKLQVLDVHNNILDALPAGIGFAPSLQAVNADRNRLTVVESSLLNGKITDLSLNVNRLTDLPTGLSGKTFNTFSIEWNFIDMSEGSDARKIADSVNAPGGKNYLRQLKIITAPTVSSTINTVMIRWQPLPEGTSGDGTWKVSKYQIYLDKNGTWQDLNNKIKPIAELDKYAGAYVVTGLQANTSYKFQIGVEYSLTLSGVTISAHRYFTEVDAKTVDAAASMDVSSAMPTDDATASALVETQMPVETTVEPQPTASAAPAKGGSTTLLIVLIIIGAIAAIAVVAIVMMLMTKKNKGSY